MLTLLTFRGGFAEPSLSPFCVKAMILLDMAGVAWQPEWRPMPGPDTWGKLPALNTGERLIPDSDNIACWLEAQGHDLHPGLDAMQRAQAHALLRMVEESLRLGLVYDRWIDDTCWPAMLEETFGAMPPHLKAEIPSKVRAENRALLEKQGIASIPPEERLRRLTADLVALEAVLGAQDWLFGQPGMIDAATLPVLSMIDRLPEPTALREALRVRPRLMDYIERGRAQLYPQITSDVAAA